MRGGTTLPELLTVLAILGLAGAVALQPVVHALDRIAVDEAVDRFAALHETTRQLAMARSNLARLELDTARRSVTLSSRTIEDRWDTVATRPLGQAKVTASQTVVTFTPYGTGWGFSNATIVMSRGGVAETLTVSRSGRLKRARS